MADSKKYRSKFYLGNAIFLSLVVGILLIVNVLSDKTSRWKVDLSEDGIYSISSAADNILAKLQDDVTVTYYCSENLDSILLNLQRDTVDLFEEFGRRSNGMFKYQVLNPEDLRSKFAEEKTDEYLELLSAGKTDELDEPMPAANPMDAFMGRAAPKPEQIREQRDKTAGAIARRSKRDKDEVFREILFQEFEDQYEKNLEIDGVRSFVGEERRADSVRQVKAYSTIKISYLQKPAEIIGRHQSLVGFEYELCRRIVKMTTAVKPTVAFFDSRKPAAPPMNPMNPMQRPPESEYATFIYNLEQLFDVREITLKEGDSIDDLVADLKKAEAERVRENSDEDDPPELDEESFKKIEPADMALLKCLIVAQPDQLEERQVYEINRAVSMGVKTIFLVSPYSLDVSPDGVRKNIPINQLASGLDDMFRLWGIESGSEVLCSNVCGSVIITQRVQGIPVPIQRPVQLPIILATTGERIDQESPYTNRIAALAFPGTTGLEIDEEAMKKVGLGSKVLARTDDETWSVKVDPMARLKNPLMRGQPPGTSVGENNEEMATPKDPDVFQEFIDSKALAVDVKGTFPFSFQGKEVPDWRPVEAPPSGGAPGGFPGMPPGGIPGLPPGFNPSIPGHGGATDGDTMPNADDTMPNANDALQEEGDVKADARQAPPPAEAKPADEVQTEPKPLPVATPDAEAVPPAVPAGQTPDAPKADAPKADAPRADDLNPDAPKSVEVSTSGDGSSGSADDAKEPAETKEKVIANVDVVPGQILVMSSVDMLKNDFLQNRNDRLQAYISNFFLFQNVVELFGMDSLLSDIRRKSMTVRRFETGSDDHVRWILMVNMGAVPALVLLIGIIRLVIRRSGSVRYEREYIQSHTGQ